MELLQEAADLGAAAAGRAERHVHRLGDIPRAGGTGLRSQGTLPGDGPGVLPQPLPWSSPGGKRAQAQAGAARAGDKPRPDAARSAQEAAAPPRPAPQPAGAGAAAGSRSR